MIIRVSSPPRSGAAGTWHHRYQRPLCAPNGALAQVRTGRDQALTSARNSAILLPSILGGQRHLLTLATAPWGRHHANDPQRAILDLDHRCADEPKSTSQRPTLASAPRTAKILHDCSSEAQSARSWALRHQTPPVRATRALGPPASGFTPFLVIGCDNCKSARSRLTRRTGSVEVMS